MRRHPDVFALLFQNLSYLPYSAFLLELFILIWECYYPTAKNHQHDFVAGRRLYFICQYIDFFVWQYGRNPSRLSHLIQDVNFIAKPFFKTGS